MHRHMYTCTHMYIHTYIYTCLYMQILMFDETKAQLLFAEERASEVEEKGSSPMSCVLLPYVLAIKAHE